MYITNFSFSKPSFSQVPQFRNATDEEAAAAAQRLRDLQAEPEQAKKFSEENKTGDIYVRPDESKTVKERNDKQDPNKTTT